MVSAIVFSSTALIYCPCEKASILKLRMSRAFHNRSTLTASLSAPEMNIS